MKQPSAGTRRASYHHGDLRAAMLRAARTVLESEGLAGLTLRAAARAAGVSHAAPRHHFGDLTGLCSELAAVGFREFAEHLEAAMQASAGQGRLDAMGMAYVAFAVEQPAMFQLMFRSEHLDLQRPALRDAMHLARDILGTEAAGAPTGKGADSGYSAAQRARVLRAWSLVHGFAMLLLDGRMAPALASVPDGDWRVLLEGVLRSDQAE